MSAAIAANCRFTIELGPLTQVYTVSRNLRQCGHVPVGSTDCTNVSLTAPYGSVSGQHAVVRRSVRIIQTSRAISDNQYRCLETN